MKRIRITDRAYGKLIMLEKVLGKDHSETIEFLVEYYIRNRDR